MEADLMRVDAMEDQEVTSRLQAGLTMGELQSSTIPNSVIPSNVRFLTYKICRGVSLVLLDLCNTLGCKEL